MDTHIPRLSLGRRHGYAHACYRRIQRGPASRIILGLGEGPAGALLTSGIYSWHPKEKRGFPSAVATGMPSMAKIALAPLLALIIASFGWRSAFGLLAVMTVIWIALWIPLWKNGPYTGARASQDVGSPAPTVPLRKILLTKTFISGSVAMFATFSIISAMITFLPTYFQRGVCSEQQTAGTLLGVVGVISLMTALPLGYFTDKLISSGHSSRALRGILPSITLILGGMGFVGLNSLPAPGWSVALYAVSFAHINLASPLLTSGISEICPPSQASSVLGIYMGIQYVGGLITPTAIGYVVDAQSNPAIGWGYGLAVLGVMAIIGGVCSLTMFNPSRDAALFIQIEQNTVQE
ncbi:MFS transporter [Glutamicibacter nicotianae]